MLHKKLNLFHAMLLGSFVLCTVAFTSCNNNGDGKDAKTDSTLTKKVDSLKTAVMDTVKKIIDSTMEKGNTRPSHTP